MKNRYRKFRRGNVFWCHDSQTGKQTSLKTKIEHEAVQFLNIKNQPFQNAAYNLEMARTHLKFGDEMLAKRTWHDVFDHKITTTTGNTQIRWTTAAKDEAYDAIKNRVAVETKAEEFFQVMKSGTVSTSVFLRRLHNHARDMGWLLRDIIPKKMWPDVKFREKDPITANEHKRIVEREQNLEKKAYYEICWLVGGSQTDMAELKAEDIDWGTNTLTYFRHKNGSKSQMQIGPELASLLRSLPSSGFLFPKIAIGRESDRAAEFKHRCTGFGITGKTLHCYRYSWAQRAEVVGYPERYAMTALGDQSKAVHRAYAKNSDVKLPSLECFEKDMKEKIIALQPAIAA
jgi:integrase